MPRPPLERLPYFKFHSADYLIDTAILTMLEHGAYLLLLVNYYWAGSLPPDRERLYRLAIAATDQEKAAVDYVVTQYFTLENGRLIHHRVERELDAYGEMLRRNSAAGLASAAARAGKPAKRTASHKGNGEAPAGFAAFWAIYPRHEARDAALKAWIKLAADESLQARILAAVEAQKQNGQWSKDNGKFIPHPATWLNARRWEDESPQPPERTVAI